MNKAVVFAVAMASSGWVQAQEPDAGLTVTGGMRVWFAEWTSFTYVNNVLTTTPSASKRYWMPVLSVRWRGLVVSASGIVDPKGGEIGERSERDINVGYAVLPGLTLSVGHKRSVQRGEGENFYRYEVRGPVIGVNGAAPLPGSPLAAYGSLAFGRLDSSGRSVDSQGKAIVFDRGRYRLTELGLAYDWPQQAWLSALTFTVGYRSQVLISRGASSDKDGRDISQGLTVGVLARY